MKINKENPEIVFVYPPATFVRSIYSENSLGVAYIQAYLHKHGINSVQIAPKNMDFYSFINKILNYNSPIIGFTCYDITYFLVKAMAESIKMKRPDIKVIVGGPTVAFSDELVMNDCPQIDICVRSEGEYTVYELIQSLKKDSPLDVIKGITFRKDKRIIRTIDRPLIGDHTNREAELDVLPSPYLTGALSVWEGNIGILTSRGCVFRCVYCHGAAISRHIVRYHSIERVISEIKKIENGINPSGDYKPKISIWDDSFSFNIDRAKKICRALIDKKINLEFYCELRADRTDKELLELLYRAGFRHVNFGLESAVPRVLRNIKKLNCAKDYLDCASLKLEREFIKRIKENVNLAKEIGLAPTVSIITGLPGESLMDGRKTLNFVKELDIKTYYHNRLTIFAGTELFKMYKRFGLKIERSWHVLPNYTRYAYDVTKIPYEKNSLQYAFYYALLRHFSDVIFGAWGRWSNKSILYPSPSIILNDFYKWNDNLLKWLKGILPIQGVLIFFYNRRMNAKPLLSNIQEMVSRGLPTREYYPFFYADIKGVPKSKILKLFASKIERPTYPFTFTFDLRPLSQVASPDLHIKKSKDKEIIIVLNSKEDIEEFRKLIRCSKENFNNPLLNKLIDLNVSFMDACRWGKKDCPCLNLNKIFVEKDNSIRPCMHAAAVGEVGDAYDKIIERLKRKFDIEKDRRGCQNCLAKDACSKCLYPIMDTEEYCMIRRNSPHASSVMELIDNLKDFELQRTMGVIVDSK